MALLDNFELPQCLRPDLCEQHFIEAYSMPQAHVGMVESRRTEIEFDSLVAPKQKTSNRDVKYSVHFYPPKVNGLDIVFHSIKCERYLHWNHPLHEPSNLKSGTRYGRVVYRAYIKVNEEWQDKGLGFCIIKQENKLYFEIWKAEEIHLLAMWKGCRVWADTKKYSYELDPKFLEVTRLRYSDWFLTELQEDIQEYYKPPSEINCLLDLPVEFLDFCGTNEIGIELYLTKESNNANI